MASPSSDGEHVQDFLGTDTSLICEHSSTNITALIILIMVPSFQDADKYVTRQIDIEVKRRLFCNTGSVISA
jgi:hypothetical protein